MEYGRVKSHQENLRQMETQEVWVVTTGLQDVSRLGSAPRGKMGVWRCPSGGSRNLLPKKAHVLKDAEVVGACILLRGDPHNAGPNTGQTREPQALLEDCGWHKASFRSASPSAPHPLCVSKAGRSWHNTYRLRCQQEEFSAIVSSHGGLAPNGIKPESTELVLT